MSSQQIDKPRSEMNLAKRIAHLEARLAECDSIEKDLEDETQSIEPREIGAFMSVYHLKLANRQKREDILKDLGSVKTAIQASQKPLEELRIGIDPSNIIFDGATSGTPMPSAVQTKGKEEAESNDQENDKDGIESLKSVSSKRTSGSEAGSIVFVESCDASEEDGESWEYV